MGWPSVWLDIFPVLNTIDQVITIAVVNDRLVWKVDDTHYSFSTILVWQSIREVEQRVDWCKGVWYTQCIPKHTFLLWLIMREKLITQDKMKRWKTQNMNMVCCLLCYKDQDSHLDIFFESCYSSQVGHRMCDWGMFQQIPPIWADIREWLVKAKSKSIDSIVGRLVIAASAYYVWQEHNNRLFKNVKRPPNVLVDEIFMTVRYKLMGLKFKKSSMVMEVLPRWKIVGDCVFDDAG